PLVIAVLRPLADSPRFPYTTLFRSVRPADDGSHADGGPVLRAARELKVRPAGRAELRHADLRQDVLRPEHGVEDAGDELSDRHGDRKSTRLNSSHLVISYAVFCLKK